MKMKLVKKAIIYILISVSMIAIFNIPMRTKQGVNGVVFIKIIPLYVKLCSFLDRDYQYKALARNITKGITGDIDKITAIYTWVIENIKRTPKDFSIIDDHVWSIVIRNYGTRGQMADLFTTLTGYKGYESFMHKLKLRTSEGPTSIILSFVKVDDTWYVFDVYNKKPFISGEAESLLTPYGPTYEAYLNAMDKRLFESSIRRPDKQKIMPRLVYEFKKIFIPLDDDNLRKEGEGTEEIGD